MNGKNWGTTRPKRSQEADIGQTTNSCRGCRRSRKRNATAYAAKEVQGGTAVTSPLCIEAFCTSATMQRQIPANISVSSTYLSVVSNMLTLMSFVDTYSLSSVTRRAWYRRYIIVAMDQMPKTLLNSVNKVQKWIRKLGIHTTRKSWVGLPRHYAWWTTIHWLYPSTGQAFDLP